MQRSPTQADTHAPESVTSHDRRGIPEILFGRVGKVHVRLETSRKNQAIADERLVEYLRCVDEATSQEHLSYLLDELASPIIKRIVHRNTRVYSFAEESETSSQDLVGETLVRVLKSLRSAKANPDHLTISNFRGLVATISYRVVAEHFRSRNRHLVNLEKKVRRLFAANADLSIWKDNEGKSICGYQTWSRTLGPQNKVASASDLSTVFDHLRSIAHKKNSAELILLSLDKLGKPIGFRALVEIINQLNPPVPLTLHETNSLEELSTTGDVPDLTMGVVKSRRLLERLFLEIQKLGIEQRKSLLLNMTDSYGFSVEWFVFTGIATESQLADLLDISTDSFRLILNDLPMTDKEIASRLGISPMRVANIRKAVRQRLARCRDTFLKENEGEG